jgi:hypothetical protein
MGWIISIGLILLALWILSFSFKISREHREENTGTFSINGKTYRLTTWKSKGWIRRTSGWVREVNEGTDESGWRIIEQETGDCPYSIFQIERWARD